MDRDTILENAHFSQPPELKGIQCRPLSATAYALMRKHTDDSGAVQTVIAAYILAGPRQQVYNLASKPEEFSATALEFGEGISVRQLDNFAEWLTNEIASINSAQTEDLPGKPQEEGKEMPHAG